MNFKLDGFRAGFMCFINETNKCLLKNGNKLFTNLDSLKAAITNARLKHHEYRILISFISKDKKRVAISYNDVMKLSDGRYIFYYNNERYVVTEENEELIIGAGYIVTNHGDTERIDDYKHGMMVYRHLTNRIMKICKELVLYPDLHLKINKHSWKRFQLGFTDSTVKVTFLDRDIMVKTNQARKEEGKKAFPFLKNMDKYSTLYAYISCDSIEGLDPGLAKMGFDLLEYITENLREFYSDLKLYPSFERIEIKTDMLL